MEENESFAKATIGSVTKEEEQLVKLLGVIWDSSADELMFNIKELSSYAESLTFTKRSLLRFTTLFSAKIFDPLGFLSLYVIQLKRLFQKLCSDHKGWDNPLQDEALEKWKEIISELHHLVPRYYFEHQLNVCSCQLYGFCDAPMR